MTKPDDAQLHSRLTHLEMQFKTLVHTLADGLLDGLREGHQPRIESILAAARGADAGPPWLAEAAEALGEVRPVDGAPLALNWTQVLEAIRDLRVDRDELKLKAEQAKETQKKLAAIATVVSLRQDAPEEWISAYRALDIIAETIGPLCSICRRRHGLEVQHECE